MDEDCTDEASAASNLFLLLHYNKILIKQLRRGREKEMIASCIIL